VLGALSCSCGDTLASEVGSAVGTWSPRLITNLRPVPKGVHVSRLNLYGLCEARLVLSGVTVHWHIIVVCTTQPPTPSGMRNEYWPESRQQGSKGRFDAFNLWIKCNWCC